LVRYGVSLRSDVRRLDKALVQVAEAQAKSPVKMNEIEEKLDGLIEIMDQSIRRDPRDHLSRRGLGRSQQV
jgi:hypothetical protein